MCSVIGYIGDNASRSFVIKGLKRLEYRGYDSAGFACLQSDSGHVASIKATGQLKNLVDKCAHTPIDGIVGVGHTRWATHGGVSENNAHPHIDCHNSIAVVHNGIIENYLVLKNMLASRGHVFYSDTDSEIIPHLLHEALDKHTDPKLAAIEVVNQLQGAYAFVAIMQAYPDIIIAARKGSPLCIGIDANQTFVSSDLFAFADTTKQVLFLPNESFVIAKKDDVTVYDFHGKDLQLKPDIVDVNPEDGDKSGYEHFMLKEIHEQKNAIQKTISALDGLSDQVWKNLHLSDTFIQELSSIHFVGCGTSAFAARIAQFFFETICRIPTDVTLASEFRYKSFFPKKNTLYVTISQSGETADTLEALRLINEHGLHNITVTNVASSTIVREAGGYILTRAGQEIAVASTKAFATQIASLYWLAHRIGVEKGVVSPKELQQAVNDTYLAAEVLEGCIENYEHAIVHELAPRYAQYSSFIFLGRHMSYPFAMEAALKLKEISYRFAQSYAAGELKHGPIALISAERPVIVFSVDDEIIYKKLLSNAQEVKARDGHLIVFAFEGQDELCALADEVFMIPRVAPLLGPLAMTGLMQFFTYHIAKVLNCSIDKPRNLAKSVTVE